jgi:mannosyltransferase
MALLWQQIKQTFSRLTTPVGLMVSLLLLAAALRIHRLGNKSVWWDEGWSVWVARQSLLDIARQVSHDVHPPLYFWLLHIWHWGSGDGEFALRFFSALLGIITIALTYQLGRTVANRYVGLLAAAFLTIARFHIAWSQEIRMYALATLLAALGAWAALRLWNREDRSGHSQWRDYLLYVLSMSGGLFTLYLFFPIPVAANIAWLWVWRRSKRPFSALYKWGAAQAAVLAPLIPWLLYARQGFLDSASATPISPLDLLKIYWTVLVVGLPLNVDQYAAYTLPVLLIFSAGLASLFWLARQQWRVRRDVTLLLAGLLLPIGVVFYITMPRAGGYAPPFSPRYLVIFTPYFAVLLAWGLMMVGSLRPRFKPLLPLLIGVVAWASWIGLRDYHPGRMLLDDYTSLGLTLADYVHEGDGVMLYTDRDWPIFAFHYPDFWHGVPHLWQITPETAASYLTPIWQAHDGLWLVTTPYAAVGDPHGHLPHWLADRSHSVTSYTFNDKQLTFYARTPERSALAQQLQPWASPPRDASLRLEPGFSLVGYEQASQDYRSGDTIHLFLYWQADGRVTASEAEIGLIDANGRAWAWAYTPIDARWRRPAGGLLRQQIDLTVPPEAPSGRYEFYVFNALGDVAHFGQVTVRQRWGSPLTAADVGIEQPLSRQFGRPDDSSRLHLLGYHLATDRTQPGDSLRLTLYWQTNSPLTERYKVFTQLLGDTYNAETENFLWGQQDNEPVNNGRPTNTWRVGELIVDEYAIPVASHAPNGVYHLLIGWYNPFSGERLPLLDEAETAAADHLILQTITITPE